MGPMTQHSTLLRTAHQSSRSFLLTSRWPPQHRHRRFLRIHRNKENYYEIPRYITKVLPCDDRDVMLHAADVFGKLFVYGDPTIVESVIEIEIQRLLDFMSRETAKSTEAERFGGLVGLNAFAGSGRYVPWLCGKCVERLNRAALGYEGGCTPSIFLGVVC